MPRSRTNDGYSMSDKHCARGRLDKAPIGSAKTYFALLCLEPHYCMDHHRSPRRSCLSNSSSSSIVVGRTCRSLLDLVCQLPASHLEVAVRYLIEWIVRYSSNVVEGHAYAHFHSSCFSCSDQQLDPHQVYRTICDCSRRQWLPRTHESCPKVAPNGFL